MANVVSIQFLQWEKWNPRKDIKHPTWFALPTFYLRVHGT